MYTKTFSKILLLKFAVFIFIHHLWHLLRPNWSIIRGTVSLKKIGRIPKSTIFSFDESDLSILKHTSKAHCALNSWPIWTQKVPKKREDVEYNLSKIRLVHKYVMIWTVYYDWICIFENYEKGLTSLPSLVTKPMQDANLNGLFISAKSVYSLFSIFTEKAFFLIPWYSPPKWYNKLGFLGWNARHPLIL